MANKRTPRIFASDFETTTYEGQTFTEVWASASVELNTEDVNLFHSISDQWDYFKSLKSNLIVYYHNLKFDGTFWLNYLIGELKYTHAIEWYDDTQTSGRWLDRQQMSNNSIQYIISSMGQWYSVLIKVNNRYIEFRDSYKLLPYSLERIGKSFKTKHQKLNMEYTGVRWAGCEITPSEIEYIKSDVLVLKEAIEILFSNGHNKLTIGACCLAEFKKKFFKEEYPLIFPNLKENELDREYFGSSDADEYVRRSYKGGWCYVVKEKQSQIFYNGSTFDVNSLYSSMMESSSGNYYPVGRPHFWKGNTIPSEATEHSRYYFVRIRTKFYLKPGYLPFIQIKGNPLYKGNENLETSDIYDYKTNRYYSTYKMPSGEMGDSFVTLTLTQTDFALFKEHYNTVDLEILDGCWFNAEIGIFDTYIQRYKEQKMTSTGAKREEAKLFLNNLYGKMASNDNSSFKIAYIKDNILNFYTIPQYEKPIGFIPIGSAITSYARNFTIRTAQKNYYGPRCPGFIYADTDSIHCDLPPSKIKGVTVHPTNFSCWSNECNWDFAIFVRQKTYIEHVVESDGKPVSSPYYDVKCAGMPNRPKQLFIHSILQDYDPSKFTLEELSFITTPRTISDFKIGLEIPSKLMPVRIPGGIVLQPTTYKLRPRLY